MQIFAIIYAKIMIMLTSSLVPAATFKSTELVKIMCKEYVQSTPVQKYSLQLILQA